MKFYNFHILLTHEAIFVYKIYLSNKSSTRKNDPAIQFLA